MKVAYFDCFSGASGDMLLGSLLDAGLAIGDLRSDLARLAVGGYRLSAERVTRRGLTGTQFDVLPPDGLAGSGERQEGHNHTHGAQHGHDHTHGVEDAHSHSHGAQHGHDHPHDVPETHSHSHGAQDSHDHSHSAEYRPARNLPAIERIIGDSDLPQTVKARSLAVFRRIARAEAAVHGTTVDQVHFHEIGAVDSLVDVVGFACALERLGIDRVYSSALTLGSGTVQTEHGRLPAPAPATLALLAEAGAPTVPGPAPTELVTPTGAALLTEFASFQQPAMTIEAVGYGFGTREFEWPNALRVWLGEPLTDSPTSTSDSVVELACNLDDASGETLGYAMERLLAAGALDVWFTPIQMKKNRPATQLSVLARPEDADELAGLLLRETPTLGVRRQVLSRSIAGRQVRTVETPWGTVRVKVKVLGGEVVAASPEYDDCARLAAAAGVPLAEVVRAARLS